MSNETTDRPKTQVDILEEFVAEYLARTPGAHLVSAVSGTMRSDEVLANACALLVAMAKNGLAQEKRIQELEERVAELRGGPVRGGW